MNKYQEALETLIEEIKFYGNLSFYSSSETILLQELVEKETPKKVFFLNYGGYKIGNWKCPVCDKIVHRGEDYCINCGQALDWSEEDES